MKAITFVLLIAALVLTTGCEYRLTGTRLDLFPLPLPIATPNRQARVQLEEVLGTFLETCDREAMEFVPPRPFEVEHLYVYDATENVLGMWSFHIFDTYKTHNDVSIVKDLTQIVPGPKKYLLKRAVLEQKTIGQFTYRGGRQEFIDTMTGEVKASRTNYYLGNDFARGVSCLDSQWSAGFRSFVKRVIGFDPGYPRSDSWVKQIPRRYVRAEFRSRRKTDATDYMAPILPQGSIYKYNDREIVINGVAHYLRQTFNQSPLSMVGVQSFLGRTLISYETNRGAPSVLFQIRNSRTGQLLQEVYIKLPLVLYRHTDKSIHPYPWRIAKEGVTFKNERINFDVIQSEAEGNSKDQKFFRYSLEALWHTENIERSDLPDYLDDGTYGTFAIPRHKVGDLLTRQQIVGKWRSIPVGALWEFNNDNTLTLQDKTIWDWKIEDGILMANQRFSTANKEKASFRSSKDGKQLEVIMRDIAGTYEPFLLNKVD